jgi:hypothetical protein
MISAEQHSVHAIWKNVVFKQKKYGSNKIFPTYKNTEFSCYHIYCQT